MVKAWSPAVRTLLPLVLAIAAGWWPGMVEAEDEYSLDEVTVTAGRLADDRLADPAFSQTITAGDLAAARPATVAEALANTAGVVLRQYGGQGQTAIPRLLGSNRLVLLIDGQRVNMPLSGSNGLDLNQFIVGGNIDHIDVTLGGAAVEYG
ncbi:MAG: TonB-dependent receptor plug domain-containing protein, partial [Negativicutes bacterium]|nr:TonB-dependent receptor plug domain-containing protein [Negativicutes bacterium]